ncbi:Uncharacterised protein [uncultured archaeon]|nr:Uncharacterised protein [uncultured archaeon]
MHCYIHPEKEAVGLCKVCNKGLCSECAVEIGDFLYCDKHAHMTPSAREAKAAEIPSPPPIDFIVPAAAAPAKAAPQRISQPAPAPAPAPRAFNPRKLVHVDLSSMLVPAVIGGIVSGTPSGIPLLNFGCLVWMLAGGAVSVYVLLVKEGLNISGRARVARATAIRTGALSGVFGAGIAFVFSAFSGITFWQQMSGILTSAGLGADYANLILQVIVVDPSLNLAYIFGKLVLLLVIFPLFGAIGALIASNFMK